MILVGNKYFSIRSLACFLMETCIILLSVVFSFMMLYGFGNNIISMQEVVARALLITVFCQLCMYLLDLYDFRLLRTFGETLFSLGITVGVACVGIGLLSFFITSFATAGSMYYMSMGVAAVSLLTWRMLFEFYITKLAPRDNILIVGTGDVAQKIGDEIRKNERLGFNLSGYISIHADEELRPGLKPLGSSEQMEKIIEEHNINMVIVAITERRGKYPVKELLALRVSGCPVVEWPEFFEKISGRILIDNLAPSYFIFNEGFEKSAVYMMFRRIISCTCAAVALVLLSPLFIAAAIAIKLDSPGPIIYSQVRVGRNGKRIRIHKFRSMRKDAEVGNKAVWAVENDPRITRVGHFMRKTRIDELPQLVNVLFGDLEFVGPRPERPEFVETLQVQIPYYALRHTVKPGLTGWAQVMFHYCGTIDESKEKLQYDLFYIKNMSLKLDIFIMFHTMKIVLLGRGAR